MADETKTETYAMYLKLSLRDFFAAFALAGLVAQTDRSMPTRVFAQEAYNCADAMLAQRQKKENE